MTLEEQEIEELKKAKKNVLEWFEIALKYGECGINLYYSPNNKAWESLKSQKDFKEAKYKGVFVGYEYKGYLFNIKYGPGDCEENLIRGEKLK